MAVYHLFFISQKQTFNVDGTDYDAWVINADGDDYYFMSPGDPRPEGYTVRDIVMVLASSGVNDMLYYVTRNLNEALKASVSSEFAGGSDTTTGSAYLSFAVMSYEQAGAHSAFPKAAAAKLALPCKWKDGVGDWQSGSLGDWISAGSPTDGFHIDVAVRVLGL